MPQQQATDLFTKHIQGQEVPSIGLGTYKLSGKVCEKCVQSALDIGYRHIDTAKAYENEKSVGIGLKESDVDRSEIFLTSKIWVDDLKRTDVRKSIESSLNDLRTEYLDLALIHWPNLEVPLEETIEALAEIRQEKRIRNIGVSNFTVKLMQKAMSCGLIFCNQVEYHPYLDQSKLLKIARDNDILITAYSPLAQGEAIDANSLKMIGEKYNKSSEQIALRWLIEQDNVVAIPRSSKVEHVKNNFDIFDFELDGDDQRRISGFPKNKRMVDPDFAPNWD